jgi:hypothetical protein
VSRARSRRLRALAIVAVLVAVTGPHLSHLYETTVATCAARGDCAAVTTASLSKDHLLQDLGDVLIALPALAGIFWGAPLVAQELEARTEYLVWTPGVTRARWILVKLGLIGCTSAAAVGLLSLMLTSWSRPFDRVNMNQSHPCRPTQVVNQAGHLVPSSFLDHGACLQGRGTPACLVSFESHWCTNQPGVTGLSSGTR